MRGTFGFPVLPLVYNRNNGSSASTHSTSHLVGKLVTTSWKLLPKEMMLKWQQFSQRIYACPEIWDEYWIYWQVATEGRNTHLPPNIPSCLPFCVFSLHGWLIFICQTKTYSEQWNSTSVNYKMDHIQLFLHVLIEWATCQKTSCVD